MNSSQPLDSSTSPLILQIRDQIRRQGPLSFDRFMEQALYHPAHGYYSSGRCAIGRRGDYFTSVSVGPLFGQLLAGQFAEIWERLERPNDFVIVEQGAHHGEFASDVLEALRAQHPEFFARLRYRIVEPFTLLRQRQEGVLRPFRGRVEWAESLSEMAPFSGVHFSNELLDAMPVHLLVAAGECEKCRWCERFVERTSCGFTFVERPIADPRLEERVRKIPPAPAPGYETEINLTALDWVATLARKLRRGVVLVADYGLSRDEFYAPSRRRGTLQCYAEHRVLPSLLENVGEADLTTHVEWTSLAEEAEANCLRVAGFTDQHHFLTGLLATHSGVASAAAEKSRALQTLIHPELLGTKFQFLGLTKEFPADESLGGFKFARDSRKVLGLA
ncbi:MAG TPA: SAM-dependent methyltransferase [Chthoniobacterales bacterium]|nr:SAM-dependent methyltransferase [Chthoniobacterales bacterium]